MPKRFQVTVLYKVAETEISIYMHWENKLQLFTITVVTYECSFVQTWNLHHPVCRELRKNGLVIFFGLPSV